MRFIERHHKSAIPRKCDHSGSAVPTQNPVAPCYTEFIIHRDFGRDLHLCRPHTVMELRDSPALLAEAVLELCERAPL